MKRLPIMKIQILTFLLLFVAVIVVAQEEEELLKMIPEMTEVWDPEVSKVTPGETPVNAPSDAIVLFDK